MASVPKDWQYDEATGRWNIIPKDFSYSTYTSRYFAWFPYADGDMSLEASAARYWRQENAVQCSSDYYDLVSPSFELGWGKNFHYYPIRPGISVHQARDLHVEMVGEMWGLKEGMKVLDCGCGIGGPARMLAKKFGCDITGITNSAWYVERGNQLTKEEGLDGQVRAIHGNFNDLSQLADDTFDLVYGFEAICYSTNLIETYKGIRRVLKPGGRFGLQEWVMTSKYNGQSHPPHVDEVCSALEEAGFKVEHEENFDKRSTPHPWYYPIIGHFWKAQTWSDCKIATLMNPVTIFFVRIQLWILILLGLRDREQMAGYEILQSCVKGVAAGSEMGIFTPMWFFVSTNEKEAIGGQKAELEAGIKHRKRKSGSEKSWWTEMPL